VSYAETLYKLIHEPHVSLRDKDLGIPDDLSDVVDRALAKQPEDRFDSAAEMAAAIRWLGKDATGTMARAVDMGEDPATVILPVRRRSTTASRSGSGTGSLLQTLETSSLSTLERQLADHIGPMAGYHLRRALRDAQSTEDFCQQVTELLPAGSRQQNLIRDALQAMTANGELRSSTGLPPAEPTRSSPDPITAEFTEAITNALMQVMGPIAPRLVARARTRAVTRAELAAFCAETIERPDERERFRSLLSKLT
jgi:hypothetical protein